MRKREEVILTQVVYISTNQIEVKTNQNLLFRRKSRKVYHQDLPGHRRGYNIDYVVTNDGKGFRWVNWGTGKISRWKLLPKEFTRLLYIAAFPFYDGEE